MADTNIVSGLFGITPQAYNQQQQQLINAEAQNFAQLDPYQQVTAGSYGAGRQLGRGIIGALGGEDPMLQKITAQSQILQGLNLEDPNALTTAAQRASQAGIPELALKLLAVRDDAAKRQLSLMSQQRLQQAQTMLPNILTQGVAPTAAERQYDEFGNYQVEPAKDGIPSMVNKQIVQQLSLSPEGQAVLEGWYKAQKTGSEADKAQAEAQIKIAEAKVAPMSQQARLLKESADAQKAAIDAKWEDSMKAAGYAKTNAEIKNINSEINVRGAKLGLDTQTTQINILEKLAQINKLNNDIPEPTRKLINDNAVIAATSKQMANQYNDLATRIEGLGGYGKFSTLGEFSKGVLGLEGTETALRQEYIRLRNTAAIKSLPPGPATDKDIALALSGFPKDTSDSKLISQFLRGMAKLQDIDASTANAKTDWLAQNNGVLTRANRTFVAGDYTARQGESFNDFSARIVKEMNTRYMGGKGISSQIPTGTGTTEGFNILNQADAILARPRGGR